MVLYEFNIIYSQYSLTLLTIAAAGLVVAAIGATVAWRSSATSTTSDNIGVLASATAIAVTLYSLLQLSLPNTPQSAAAPACQNAPVHGSRAQGQTTELGVNGRSGVGSAYSVKDRFGPRCTIGFDGFCYGEGVANSTRTNLADQRWLIVHGRSETVSAAYVDLQSAQAKLGNSASRSCKKFSGGATPTLSKWVALSAKPGVVQLAAQTKGAAIVSFGVLLPAAIAGGSFPFLEVAYYSGVPTSKGFGSAATWKTAPLVPLRGKITMIAVAEACSANDAKVPGTGKYKVLTFVNGKLATAKDIERGTVPNADKLDQETCSLE
ncbi:hypothetical protein [Jatrophihabitans sp.]|uniref:hypothetical protein n=1 Tax=Jatrophihabitans sp. TaxID=1932789 RepID=UPI002F0EFA44